MVTGQGCIALITARGGSKSIPKKNIKNLGGHPLIAYSIAVAKATSMVDRVVVSTDCEEIAEVSKHYGAEVPFLRPAEFSLDDTEDYPVFLHALEWMKENEGQIPEMWVHLRPTSPFRKREHLEKGISLLRSEEDASSVRAVCEPFQIPHKMWSIEGDGFMSPLGHKLGMMDEPYNKPRQHLPKIYWQTGYLDAVKSTTLTKHHSMTGPKVLPLITSPSDIIDIDTLEDWRRAEEAIKMGMCSAKDLGFKI